MLVNCRSGTEEEFTYKSQLLTEISELQIEFLAKNQKDTTMQQVVEPTIIEEMGHYILPNQMEDAIEHVEPEIIVERNRLNRRRRRFVNPLERNKSYQLKKEELQLEIQKLEFEKQKLELEREKFEEERLLRRKEVEMSLKEREYNLEKMKLQDQFIKKILEKELSKK